MGKGFIFVTILDKTCEEEGGEKVILIE